jgi:hypothetical protein
MKWVPEELAAALLFGSYPHMAQAVAGQLAGNEASTRRPSRPGTQTRFDGFPRGSATLRSRGVQP